MFPNDNGHIIFTNTRVIYTLNCLPNIRGVVVIPDTAPLQMAIAYAFTDMEKYYYMIYIP